MKLLDAIHASVAAPCPDGVVIVLLHAPLFRQLKTELEEWGTFPGWAEGIDIEIAPPEAQLPEGRFRVARRRPSGTEYLAEEVSLEFLSSRPAAEPATRKVRAAIGPRGSVVFNGRLTGDRVTLRANFVRELANGILGQLHATHDHDSLEKAFAEILQAVKDEELLAEQINRGDGS